MVSVSFHEVCEIPDAALKYAVICARYRERWIFCRHRARKTWECPGGHREDGETIAQTARRELWEETGAVNAELIPICVYKAWDYGMLYFAQVSAIAEIPIDSEIEQICFVSEIPKDLTYSGIHDKLFEKVKDMLKHDKINLEGLMSYGSSVK